MRPLLNMDNNVLPSWLVGLSRSGDEGTLGSTKPSTDVRGVTGFTLHSDLGMHRACLDKCGTHTSLTKNEGLKTHMGLGLDAAAVQTCGLRNFKSAVPLSPGVFSVTVPQSAHL